MECGAIACVFGIRLLVSIDEQSKRWFGWLCTNNTDHSPQHQTPNSALDGLGDTPVWRLQRDCSRHEEGTCGHHHTAALIHATHRRRDLDGDGTIGGFSPWTTKMDLGGVGGLRVACVCGGDTEQEGMYTINMYTQTYTHAKTNKNRRAYLAEARLRAPARRHAWPRVDPPRGGEEGDGGRF